MLLRWTLCAVVSRRKNVSATQTHKYRLHTPLYQTVIFYFIVGLFQPLLASNGLHTAICIICLSVAIKHSL